MKIITILLLFMVSVHAQTIVKDLPDHINRVNIKGEWSALRDSCIKYQKDFYETNKFFFQGLADRDSSKMSDQLNQFNRSICPTDQKQTWEDFGLRDVSIRGKLWIDVYEIYEVWGYQIFYSIQNDSSIYTIQYHDGPETWREWNDWRVTNPPKNIVKPRP